MKQKLFNGIAVFLSFILVFVSLNIYTPVQANENETKKTYPGYGYVATYTLFASWDGGSNFQIELKNTGSQKIENWSLLVEYDDEINNIWNARIEKHDGNKYTISNAGWNQDIEAGQSICFGMSSSSAFSRVPASITLIDNARASKTSGVRVEYTINNNWGNGCTGSISITNQSDKDIEDWSLELDCANNEITFWDGNILSHEGSHYVVHNAGYNSVIKPGQSTDVGFIVYGTITDPLFTSLTLTEKTEYSDIYEDDEPDEIREKEPLGDIGEAYFKEAKLEDVILDTETGLQYVKNQLLISAYMGTPKEAIEEIAEEFDAEIVGYTAITCNYQFEFKNDMSLDDLEEVAEYLEGYPYISAVFLNTVMGVSIDEEANDFLYNDGFYCETGSEDVNNDGNKDDEDFDYLYSKTPSAGKGYKDAWNESAPAGDNWGLEALHVPSAWDLVKDSSPVKVGIIDSYFEDVISINGKRELIFDDILLNIVPNKPTPHKYAHGDHVAGIIGAAHNNKFGISGVATNVRLYAHTMSESTSELPEDTDINSAAGVLVALDKLICNNVKIINMSLGYGTLGDGGKGAIVYAASHDNSEAVRKINYDASVATEHLRKLINAGYDFLIVKSAGNYNNDYFIYDDNSMYDYRVFQTGDDINKRVSGGVLAQYGHYINNISDPEVKDRIIVVGAFSQNDFSNGNQIADFSGIGDRVDVIAPGVGIISTAPLSSDYSAVNGVFPIIGFKMAQGTSQAAPHISGIAALICQMHPGISAKRLKSIICSDNNIVKQINGYNVPNAKLCLEQVADYEYDENWPTGIIAGSVRSENDINIIGANIHIQAIRHSTGDYSLDRYAFNFEADEDGNFIYSLPQGTYDLLVYLDNCAQPYLPTTIKNIEIKPDETTYVPTIRLSKWTSRASGNVKGMVNDAITGQALDGVIARIRKGWNTTEGAYVSNLTGTKVKQATTGTDGKFSISAAIGAYTVELVKAGYVTAYYNVLATEGNIVTVGYDTAMTMTPVLPDDEYRIVLAWGNTPSDLDSHLLYYINGVEQFHVCYWNKSASIGDKQVAVLDLDDTSYYGPETVTVTVDAALVENGELHYCVHNFSGGLTQLSASNASVRIYRGNSLIDTYTVLTNQQALVWHVFNITKDGIKSVYDFNDIIN